MSDEDYPQIARLRCPGCEEEVDIDIEAVGKLVRCPYCNTDFFASEEQSHLEVVDDRVDPGIDRESTLDMLHVSRLAASRMGTVHDLRWNVIGFWLCVLTALELFLKLYFFALQPGAWGAWPTIEVVLAAAAWMGARATRRRAKTLREELKQSALIDPITPPDFTTLNDGHDRWKHLENVR